MNMTYLKVFKWIVFVFLIIAIIKGLGYFMKTDIPREGAILDKELLISEINKSIVERKYIFRDASVGESIEKGESPNLHCNTSIIGVEKSRDKTVIYAAAKVTLLGETSKDSEPIKEGYTPVRAVFISDGKNLKLNKLTISRVAEKNRTQTLIYPIIIHDRYMYEEIPNSF
ncbi:MAG: hypothetical protein RR840_04540 [Clostridium sp.]